MELRTTECIGIINNNREYTDCMEFSLLRCLQLFTYNPVKRQTDNDDGIIGESYISAYIDPIYENPLLHDFIEEYPIIYTNSQHYRHNCRLGVQQRTAWSKVVSDRTNLLDYYRNDHAELFTSIENIIKFFHLFFPNLNLLGCPEDLCGHSGDLMNINDKIVFYQTMLNKIAKGMTDLANTWIISSYSNIDAIKKSISIHVKTYHRDLTKKQMPDIVCMVSRPEINYGLENEEASDAENDEYILAFQRDPDAWYDVVIRESQLELSVDGYEYVWQLSETYFDDHHKSLFKNIFITGHSVIYNV